MLITGKGRYAVTAMMSLAMNKGKGPVSLADISQSQGISLSYLEQIFARLRRHGLVRGTRGRRGGYRLSRPATGISIADIIRAVEEEGEGMEAPPAVQYTEAPGNLQSTQPQWDNLNARLYDFLANIDLEQAVSEGIPGAIPLRPGAGEGPQAVTNRPIQ